MQVNRAVFGLSFYVLGFHDHAWLLDILLIVALSPRERVVILECGADKGSRAEPVNRGPCQTMG